MGQGESMELRWEGGPHPANLGVMVCGHGSRNPKAVAEFAQLTTGLARLLPHHPLAYGYLEFAHPVIPAGLDRLRSVGVKQVVAVPGMLFAAGHVKNDIPALLNRYSAATGLPISYGRELGMDARMVRAAAARITAALPPEEARGEGNLVRDTLLVVVGRGSRDPDANGNVAKITRMLVEGLGLGWGETCYAGVTFPQVEDCLRRAVGLGYRRIVVFPYFLFSGVLVSRIHRAVDRVAADHPQLDIRKASYLSDHPLVLDTFRARAQEALEGNNAMNCALCKYRTQVLGFENDHGAPQQSHHHHHEGLGEPCTLCPGDCTGACEEDVKAKAYRHSHHH
ncbi:MAG: sirohydrochlorin chelatase [Cyanobacteria bacterium MAG CAR3_bin_5]|nr:sirohydrochlorin chelatase [Cyanobacteria bacterium MAG CAR3_bin_5]